KTPFHKYHVDHGAKLVPYAGWEMPLLYSSIIEEHRQVRTSGGLFDVSHMGRIRFSGRDACRFLDRICTRKIHGTAIGQARYTIICNERGGCLDDALVTRLEDNEYLMVCNAANREKLLQHFAREKGDFVFKQEDQTTRTAMIALQGPKVMEMLSAFSSEIPGLKRYRSTTKSLLMAKFIISRTGYTGEDGVEVILPSMFASKAVDMMLKNVDSPDMIKPCGLGSRDSLRLEAGMALYGHEIDEDTDPLTANLHFAVSLDKGIDDPEVENFIGQEALRRIAESGPARTTTGLVLEGRRAPRQGMSVVRDGQQVGVVTSGCLSPTLDKPIAIIRIDAEHAQEGVTLGVDFGKQVTDGVLTPLPFYSSR
ncbi:MAG TPA: glycine cleavage system aminomethyltransferase GcvT, partial [Phycisphaerales bacterium]|nr:glycine cleavage system aminomethyltransferase GcvT [Phycisphaerales bacterium]